MKLVLLFLLDGYADWEAGFTSAKLNKPDLGYCVRTISIEKKAIISQGNFSTNIDYSLDSFCAYDKLAAFLLIGGTGWESERLIRSSSLNLYDVYTSTRIAGLVDKCLSLGIPVAAICDGATFLADKGYLDDKVHTGNMLTYLKEKAPFY